MKHLVKSAVKILAASAVGLWLTSCGKDATTTVPQKPVTHESEITDAASKLSPPGAAIVRVPFDESGNALPDKAEMRVLDSTTEVTVSDVASAESAWNRASVPASLTMDEMDGETSNESYHVNRRAYSNQYINWNRQYTPSYYNSGYRWNYGTPGFYGSNGRGYGYGSGYNHPRYGYYHYPQHGGRWDRR